MLSETSRSDTLLFWPLKGNPLAMAREFPSRFHLREKKFSRDKNQAEGFVT